MYRCGDPAVQEKEPIVSFTCTNFCLIRNSDVRHRRGYHAGHCCSLLATSQLRQKGLEEKVIAHHIFNQ